HYPAFFHHSGAGTRCCTSGIEPVFGSFILILSISATLVATVYLQAHVLEHLPTVDCLPYKKGNDLLQLRQMPEDAIPDVFDYNFVYKKEGVTKEFNTANLPDSTWEFVERKQVLVKKGKNNVPKINDFSLKLDSYIYTYEKDGTPSDFEANDLPDSTWKFVDKKTVSADSTQSILGQSGEYYLFFLKTMKDGTEKWSTGFADLLQKAKEQNRKIYIITSEKEPVEDFFNKTNQYNVPVYTCDMTAIKTAARSTPTLFLMHGPVVQDKWGWADIEKAAK
ncbi:MAG: hypothetical protein HY305_07605, partial [Sphingobacteriales bacterium]|nr:hypothetical protein [Sphingobacteriales bacterium]